VLKQISSCIYEKLNEGALQVDSYHVKNARSITYLAVTPQNRKITVAATFQSSYALFRVHLITVIVIVVNVAEVDADPTFAKVYEQHL
jgi:hypothetical protein